jgi:hypothetical protein
MSDIARLDASLNAQILEGRILEAFDQYYADDVLMQENTAEPTTGKATNRKREEEFVGSIAEVHGSRLLGSAVNGDTAYSEWEMDLTFKNGYRAVLTQVASRRWKDGKVVWERFYYHKG